MITRTATIDSPVSTDLSYHLEPHGYLKDSALWTWEIAQVIADSERVGTLTKDHRRVVEYVRKYYDAYEVWPIARRIKKDIGCADPCRLFKGPSETIFKVAGLPNPRGSVRWGFRRLEICP